MTAFEIVLPQPAVAGRPVFGHPSPRCVPPTAIVPGEDAPTPGDEPTATVDQEFEEYFFE